MKLEIKQILREKLFDEARKTSGVFLKEENLYALLEYLYNKYGFERIYLSFRESLHTGIINPRNQYDTPTGLYAYNLIEYLKEPIASIRDFVKLFPFASDRPYGQFLAIRENVNLLNSKTDISKIDEFVKKLASLYPNTPIEKLCEEWLNRTYKSDYGASKNDTHKFWLFLYSAAKTLGGRKQNQFLLLCKKIGVDGFEDDNCEGWIHPNEKCQSVFFNINAFEEKREIYLKPRDSRTNRDKPIDREKVDSRLKDIETRGELINLLNKHNERVPLDKILKRFKVDEDGNIILLKDEAIKNLFYKFYKNEIINNFSLLATFPKQMMFFINDLLKNANDKAKLFTDDNIYYLLTNNPFPDDYLANLIIKNIGEDLSDSNINYLVKFGKDKETIINYILDLKKDTLTETTLINILSNCDDIEKTLNIVGIDKAKKLITDNGLRRLASNVKDKKRILNVVFKHFNDKLNNALIHDLIYYSENPDYVGNLMITLHPDKLNDNTISKILQSSTDKNQTINLILKYKGGDLTDGIVNLLITYSKDKKNIVGILGPDIIKNLSNSSIYGILISTPTDEMFSLLGSDNIKKLDDYDIINIVDNSNTDTRDNLIDTIIKYRGEKISDAILNRLLIKSSNPINVLNKVGVDRFTKLKDDFLSEALRYSENKDQLINLIIKYKGDKLNDNLVNNILHYSENKNQLINLILKYKGQDLTSGNIVSLLAYTTDISGLIKILGPEEINKLTSSQIRNIFRSSTDRIKLFNELGDIINKIEDVDIAWLIDYLGSDYTVDVANKIIKLRGDELSDRLIKSLISYSKNKEELINLIIKHKGGKLSEDNITTILRYHPDKNKVFDIVGEDYFKHISDKNLTELFESIYGQYSQVNSIINLLIKYKGKHLTDTNILTILSYTDSEHRDILSNTILKLKGDELTDNIVYNLLNYSKDRDQIINLILKYMGGNLTSKMVDYILYYGKDKEKILSVLDPEIINRFTNEQLYTALYSAVDYSDFERILSLLGGPKKLIKLSDSNLVRIFNNISDKEKMTNLLLKYVGKDLSENITTTLIQAGGGGGGSNYNNEKVYDLITTLIKVKGDELTNNDIVNILSYTNNEEIVDLIIKNKGENLDEYSIVYLFHKSGDIEKTANKLGSDNINKLSGRFIKTLLETVKDKEQMIKILGTNINKLNTDELHYIKQYVVPNIYDYVTKNKDKEVSETIKEK